MSGQGKDKQGRKLSAAEWVALAAVGINTALTGLKFFLAWISGSLSLRVEAFHSFADIGSSLAVFLAVRAEMSPAAEGEESEEKSGFFSHPQRIVSLGIGIFLAVVGVFFIRRVIAPETLGVSYPVPVALAMLLLALFSFLLSRLERVVGERDNCTALVADSFHARVDMAGSLLVAGALLGESLGVSLDRWAALALALFILSQALNVFGAVIRDMTTREPEPDMLYREWLWQAVRKRVPDIGPRLLSLAARMTGGSSESEADRNKAARLVIAAFIVAALTAYMASGLFTVGASEQAIVEHLGKPVNLKEPLQPGLHWKWPWPVGKTRKVDVRRIRRLAVGSEVRPDRRVVLWTNEHYVEQFNLLSGENIFVDVGVVLHYRVHDLSAWLYNFRDPESLLNYLTSAVLTQEFSKRRFMESMTTGRDALEADLEERVKEAMEPFDTGTGIVALYVRDAHPPLSIAPAFEEVVSARIEYETRINEAKGYMNDLIPRARGEAATRTLAAEALKTSMHNRARGEAARFLSMLEAYRTSPLATRTRMSIEAAEEALPGREKIIVPADPASGAVEIFMTKEPGWAPGSSGEK